jgi:hypothetical protein
VNSHAGIPTKASEPRLQLLLLAVSVGLLPYIGGALVVVTREFNLLVFVGVLICAVSTYGAYLVRSYGDPMTARQRLIVDPFLYGFEYVFTAVVIRYVFLR